MTSEHRVKLWEAVNEYAKACGGDTSSATSGDRRMDAVANVDRAAAAVAGAPSPFACKRCGGVGCTGNKTNNYRLKCLECNGMGDRLIGVLVTIAGALVGIEQAMNEGK